jgi:ABC-type branched-subunit amino acid transport system substrate-binding protein
VIRAGACLSLSGRFAPFGRQAANGLRLWADSADITLTVLDDESDCAVLAERMPDLAADTDLLFGPYSTVLLRAALPIAAAADRLLFNHGGSGGDLDAAGRMVNVLTPARRYALPFVEHIRGFDRVRLFTASRRGAFGRDVAAGAAEAAHAAGLEVETLDLDAPPDGVWDLLSAGVYEDDIETVRAVRALANPPRFVCSAAAGVAQFAGDVPDADGVFGVGQWAPSAAGTVTAGPAESDLLDAWHARFGGVPDYPGVQAFAAGVIAQTTIRTAGTAERDALWQTVAAMDVRSAFGRFRLNPETGEQQGHESVLTQWHGKRQVIV